jgi:hypothetical protein
MNKALFAASCRTWHRLNNANFAGLLDTREADRIFYEFTKAAILSSQQASTAKETHDQSSNQSR